MPLRRLYILKLKLTFPSSVATAYTIRSLHVGRAAAATARKKTWALVVSFLVSICWRVTSEYAPGIMWDWHWSWWFYRAGWKWIICAESWVCSGLLRLILKRADCMSVCALFRDGYGSGRLRSSGAASSYQ